MKRHLKAILVSCLGLCLSVIIIMAMAAADRNSSSISKVNRIVHPSIDMEKGIIKPLILDYQTDDGDMGFWRYKEVYYPMVNYSYISFENNKEELNYEGSCSTLYNAYELPHVKGYVLFKKTNYYEVQSEFQELDLVIFGKGHYTLEPHGEHVMFTKDYRYLVTIHDDFDPYITDEENYRYIIYYYNLTDSGDVKPFRKELIDHEKYKALNLVSFVRE